MGDRSVGGGGGTPSRHTAGPLSTANELTGAVFGTAVQAGSIQGGIQLHVAPPSRVETPAQLLADPAFFAGRERELEVLDGILGTAAASGTATLVVIGGAGGVGKTTMGLYWLHRLREHYRHGQLYADLRGLSEDGPSTSGEILDRFVRALGVGSERIPTAEDELSALFRTLTAGRRLIVMLDNAVSAAQVRPLLPGHGPAVVVVTSRQRLTGLAMEGARFVDLGPLDEDNALALLVRMLGEERVRAEPEAARSLVRLCARLPLALCASGARLAARRRLTISRVVAELADEAERLAVLGRQADVSVQAVFDASYDALEADTARLYRLLGLVPGVQFGADAAAAVAGCVPDRAADLLDLLADANLLEERSVDRYALHDLLRLHARGKTADTESDEDRDAALRRLADWYLRTAVRADKTVTPGRWHLGPYYANERLRPFPNPVEALDWLDLERDNLIAVAETAHRRGWHETAWQICEATWSLWIRRKHYRLWLRTYEVGIAAARACEDRLAEARMLEGIAAANLNLKDFDTAIEHAQEALELERAAGHPVGEATALEYLGVAHLGGNRLEHALDAFARARDIHQRIDVPRGVALMDRRIGEALRDRGDHSGAIEHLVRACAYFAENDDPYNRAQTLTGLGRVYLMAGRPDDAETVLRTALRVSDETGARHQQAGVHAELAGHAVRAGARDAEREHLRQALDIYLDLGAPQAAEIRDRLTAIAAETARETPG